MRTRCSRSMATSDGSEGDPRAKKARQRKDVRRPGSKPRTSAEPRISALESWRWLREAHTRAHLHQPDPAARVSRALVPLPLPRQVARNWCSRAGSRRRRGRRAHPRARSPPSRLPGTVAACSRGRAARALRIVPALGEPMGGGMQVPGRAARGHHPRAWQGASRASNAAHAHMPHTALNSHLWHRSLALGACWQVLEMTQRWQIHAGAAGGGGPGVTATGGECARVCTREACACAMRMRACVRGACGHVPRAASRASRVLLCCNCV